MIYSSSKKLNYGPLETTWLQLKDARYRYALPLVAASLVVVWLLLLMVLFRINSNPLTFPSDVGSFITRMSRSVSSTNTTGMDVSGESTGSINNGQNTSARLQDSQSADISSRILIPGRGGESPVAHPSESTPAVTAPNPTGTTPVVTTPGQGGGQVPTLPTVPSTAPTTPPPTIPTPVNPAECICQIIHSVPALPVLKPLL